MNLRHINLSRGAFEHEPLPYFCKNPIILGKQYLSSEEHIWYGEKASLIYSLRLVPQYYQFSQAINELVHKRVPQENWGYSILLDGYTSVDAYMQEQFKSKPRSIIRRYVQRLELCFPIRYKTYTVNMDQNNYNFLMQCLRNMITNRFGQRMESHKEMQRWAQITKDSYSLINAGSASLFVIYDGEKPIEISLNFHLGPILLSSISSYDIDYQKFGLGHVEIVKQLEWCLENGMRMFDMGVGEMDYKRRWSNHIYRYYHDVMFPKGNPVLFLIGQLTHLRVYIKEYLKSLKINELRDKTVQGLQFKSKNDIPEVDEFQVEHLASFNESNAMESIPMESPLLSPIRRYIYDFMYTNCANTNEVLVYRNSSQPKQYIIKAGKNQLKLTPKSSKNI